MKKFLVFVYIIYEAQGGLSDLILDADDFFEAINKVKEYYDIVGKYDCVDILNTETGETAFAENGQLEKFYTSHLDAILI